MKASFDLIGQPWIPCVRSDGVPVDLGLRDTLVDAHHLREVAGESPLVTLSLYRLLLAILTRVFAPRDLSRWHQLQEAGRWDPAALDDYFCKWRSRLNLFDSERPFYQTKDARVRSKSVASMIAEIASGANATLFDHHTELGGLALSPPAAARAVVAAQSCSLAGLSGLPEKFTDSTCARGVIFFVEGDSLFETLLLNLIPYPSETRLPSTPDDAPAWEMGDPFVPERSLPLGYLDYLTWQSRRVLVQPEEGEAGIVVKKMTWAPGLRLEADLRDPMKRYRIDPKRGPMCLRFSEERALWRDSATLFQLRHAAQGIPPAALEHVANLVESEYLAAHQARRCLALGMANDQAKVEFCRAERLPLPLQYLRKDEEKTLSHLTDALEWAEGVGRALRRAAFKMADEWLKGQRPDGAGGGKRRESGKDPRDALVEHWGVERHYWADLEVGFRHLLLALPDDATNAGLVWQQLLRRTAWTSFEESEAALGGSPAALRASVKAREQLAAGLGTVLPKLNIADA